MRKVIRYAIQGLEFLLAALFIQGGVRAFTIDELPEVPGSLHLLANQEAVYVYGVMWITTGISLIVAKIFRLKELHGWSLMIMYLTCFYVLILASLINGIHWEALRTLTVALASGALYVRWKYRLRGRLRRPKEDESGR